MAISDPTNTVLAALIADQDTDENYNPFADWEATSTATPVTLSASDTKMFWYAVSYFAKPDMKNSETLKRNFPTEEAAAEFTNKLKLFAAKNNLSLGLPTFMDGHMTKDVVDKDTLKVTKPAHWVEANKYPKSWNVGTNVTFRITRKRAAKVNLNGPVTTDTVAARAARNAV